MIRVYRHSLGTVKLSLVHFSLLLGCLCRARVRILGGDIQQLICEVRCRCFTGDFTCLTFSVTNKLSADKRPYLVMKANLSIFLTAGIYPLALMRFANQ